jgi:hypothetical protein
MLTRSREMDHSCKQEVTKEDKTVMKVGTFQSEESSIKLGKIIIYSHNTKIEK